MLLIIALALKLENNVPQKMYVTVMNKYTTYIKNTKIHYNKLILSVNYGRN
jgi:hypothetical protein